MGKEDGTQQYSFSLDIAGTKVIVSCDRKLYQDYTSISSLDNIESIFPDETLSFQELKKLKDYFAAFLYGVSLVVGEFEVESPQILIVNNPEEVPGYQGIGYFPEQQLIGISRNFLLDLLRVVREVYVSGDAEQGCLLIITVDPTMHILTYGIQETVHHYQKLRSTQFSNRDTPWSQRDEEIEAYDITKQIIQSSELLKEFFVFIDKLE